MPKAEINSRKKNWFSKSFKSSKKKVIVIRLQGAIGIRSQGQSALTMESLRETFDDAFGRNPDLICLAINSPGGSPVQSALIASRIVELSKEYKIPVWSFVEDVAASGGYWLACAGEKIIAHNSSIVGSIGVIAAGFGFEKLIEKMGIQRRVYTSGTHKSQLDPFLPENLTDIEHIQKIQKDIHEDFVSYVKERRGTKLKEDVEPLFEGDFWSGKKGLELGLVDELNTLYPTLKKQFGKKFKIRYMQMSQGSFLKRLFGLKTKNLNEIVDIMEEKTLWSQYGL